MSFILRPFRHSVGRYRAGADLESRHDEGSDEAADAPDATGSVHAESRRRYGRLTAEDLRAAAGRAAAAGAFDDGLPIRVSLD